MKTIVVANSCLVQSHPLSLECSKIRGKGAANFEHAIGKEQGDSSDKLREKRQLLCQRKDTRAYLANSALSRDTLGVVPRDFFGQHAEKWQQVLCGVLNTLALALWNFIAIALPPLSAQQKCENARQYRIYQIRSMPSAMPYLTGRYAMVL